MNEKLEHKINLFKEEKDCFIFLFYLYNKQKEICLKCNKMVKYYLMLKYKKYSGSCGHQIFPTKNTIFWKSSIPLNKWFNSILIYKYQDNELSAKYLQRLNNVTYKTALKMLWKIIDLESEDPNLYNKF